MSTPYDTQTGVNYSCAVPSIGRPITAISKMTLTSSTSRILTGTEIEFVLMKYEIAQLCRRCLALLAPHYEYDGESACVKVPGILFYAR